MLLLLVLLFGKSYLNTLMIKSLTLNRTLILYIPVYTEHVYITEICMHWLTLTGLVIYRNIWKICSQTSLSFLCDISVFWQLFRFSLSYWFLTIRLCFALGFFPFLVLGSIGHLGLTSLSVQFSSVQSLSRVRLFATLWIAAPQASLSITNSRSLLRLTPIESVMPSSHLILCRPLLLLPPTPPSIRVFSNESTLRMRWPKYWSFSFSISPSNEHPGLISFKMDWLDLLAVQGTLKSLLQHHSSKASIFLDTGSDC